MNDLSKIPKNDIAEPEKTMALVLIALFPTLAAGTYIFGTRVIILTVVCVAACILFELLFCLAARQRVSVRDASAAVTGVIVAFLLPSEFPYWMAVTGCFFAIVAAKMIFGGLGQNFVNPAAAGYAFLTVCFPEYINSLSFPNVASDTGDIAAQSPLMLWALEKTEEMPTYIEMFLGFISGGAGSVCLLTIMIGGIFLIWKKVISPLTPVAFLLAVAGTAFLIPGEDPLFHILAGSTFIGAFFLAGDSSTTPKGKIGKIVFGICAGVLAMGIRMSGMNIDGVIFAILLMNMITPYMDIMDKRIEKVALQRKKGDAV